MLTGVARRGAHASDAETTEAGTKGVAKALRDALSKDATRIIQLFKEWDEDRNGSVSKKEWRKAIPLLGLDVPKAQLSAELLNQLFDEWDPDKSGRLSMGELMKKLRSGSDPGRASLQPGAAGEIGTVSTTKIAVRKGISKRGSALAGIDIDEDSGTSVAEQLRSILSKNAVRVIDLFREWDEDGDGTVSKQEFRKAMPLLGFDAPRAQVDQVFDELDPDGGGAISIDELNKALRRGGDAKLQMSSSGAASAIARARRNSNKLDVDTSGRGGGMPIAPPTVKFHVSDVVEYEAQPRWDASRSSKGSSSAHAINTDRLSEVILEDRKRERLQEAAREKGGWDVGQRPKAAMTYLEYPLHTRTEVTARSFDVLEPFDSFESTNLTHGKVARSNEQRERHRELERCGWGSSGLHPYRPLGHMEQHVTPIRFMAARHVNQVKVVDPDVPELPVGEARIHALNPGRRTSARVHQHSYAFYCIDVQPGLVLRVKVTTVRGDPDLYMCNRHTHPTHEQHTWRATGVGDDVIKIKPDHPNAVPGTYYISVYGVQESDFQLEAALVPMDIKLPQKEGAAILKGMKLLQREVVKGAQQRRTLNAGGSLRVEFANELRGRGVPREAVHAAAAPVEQALHAAADEGKRAALASSGAARREEARTKADCSRPSKRTIALGKSLLPPEEITAARQAVHESLRAVRSDAALMAEDSADVRRSRGELKPLRPERGAALELEWQLHPGQSWAELPRGTRLQVASSEYNQRKKSLHAQLQSQIASLAERRPARYEMRMQSMQALEAVHPKLINDAKAMRHCSEAMHSAYLRRQEDELRRASLVMPASPAGSSPPRGSTSPTERPASHAASRAASRAASGAATPAEERCWMDDPFAEGAAAPSSRPRSRAEPGFNLLGALDETLALIREPPPVVVSPRTWSELPTMPLGMADAL